MIDNPALCPLPLPCPRLCPPALSLSVCVLSALCYPTRRVFRAPFLYFHLSFPLHSPVSVPHLTLDTRFLPSDTRIYASRAIFRASFPCIFLDLTPFSASLAITFADNVYYPQCMRARICLQVTKKALASIDMEDVVWKRGLIRPLSWSLCSPIGLLGSTHSQVYRTPLTSTQIDDACRQSLFGLTRTQPSESR